MPTFNEDNTIEQMTLSALENNGWKYIPSDELPRSFSDVMVEPMVKAALIRLNPEIASEPNRADEVIYKLRSLILSVQAHDLITYNEKFKKMMFEENLSKTVFSKCFLSCSYCYYSFYYYCYMLQL